MLLLGLLSSILCAAAFTDAAGVAPDAHHNTGRLHRVKRQAAVAGPAPTALARRHADYTTKHLQKRAYSGRATYFAVGLGACGWTSTADEAVVALAESVWNQKDTGNPNTNGWCGTSITISYGGIQKQATIVDLCPVDGGCLAEDGDALNLSQSLFQSFSDLSAGIFQMTWWVNDGSDDGSGGDTGAITIPTATTTDNGAAEAAAAASSSSAAAAAWAAEQASSSEAAAAAWAAQQSSSSAAAAAAAASSRSHEAWVSWNSVMSTSWEGVLAASSASVASEASVQAAASQASAAEAREAKASRASARKEASAASAASLSAATATGKSSSNNKVQDEDDDEATAANVSDSSLKAINDVSLRLANLVSLYVADTN